MGGNESSRSGWRHVAPAALCLTLALTSAPARALDYAETNVDDLFGSELSPDLLGLLDEGDNTISGWIEPYQDTFQVAVPPGHQITHVSVSVTNVAIPSGGLVQVRTYEPSPFNVLDSYMVTHSGAFTLDVGLPHEGPLAFTVGASAAGTHVDWEVVFTVEAVPFPQSFVLKGQVTSASDPTGTCPFLPSPGTCSRLLVQYDANADPVSSSGAWATYAVDASLWAGVPWIDDVLAMTVYDDEPSFGGKDALRVSGGVDLPPGSWASGSWVTTMTAFDGSTWSSTDPPLNLLSAFPDFETLPWQVSLEGASPGHDCLLEGTWNQFMLDTNLDGLADVETDSDGDLLPDDCDNCPAVHNPAQVDADWDGLGDDCDPCPLDDPNDSDNDGVCDSDDLCPGDDGADSDSDGVCDGLDVCAGYDDADDADGDGVPDGCDPCPADSPDDSDGDEVCDSDDVCPGHDDISDTDLDGVPDGCDACPEDALNDADEDGVCDGADVCQGHDDAEDADGDGLPDGCDPCPLDDPGDSDGDDVCDSDDLCPGEDDTEDADADGVPDGCDACPDDPSITEGACGGDTTDKDTSEGGCSGCSGTPGTPSPTGLLLGLGLVTLRRRSRRG